MRPPLEKEIKLLLLKKQNKKTIYKTLASDTNKYELVHLLNNLPNGHRRQITFFLTLLLVLILALLTIKQLLFIYLHTNSNISLILAFIAPIIHVYIIRELLSSHRLAYQILPLLSVLAIFRPENRIYPDIYMYIFVALLSGILYFFLFPKSERISPPTQ